MTSFGSFTTLLIRSSDRPSILEFLEERDGSSWCLLCSQWSASAHEIVEGEAREVGNMYLSDHVLEKPCVFRCCLETVALGR